MSYSVNEATILGHVGYDPTIRVTGTGKPVVNLSVATNGKKNAAGDAKVEWHRVTCWDRLAGFVNEYVGKGDRVYVKGRIEYGSYEKDGDTIQTTDIIAKELILLSNRRGGTPDTAEALTDEELEA